MEENPWITHRQETVYDNNWLKVTHREVTNPSGGEGIYGVVHFKNRAIGIVALDEEDHIWMVGQFRYATNRYEWEIPEGGAPYKEDMLTSAKRELAEETGLRAKRWDVLIEHTYLSNSITDEIGRIYLARDLEMGHAAPEETEDLKLKKIPFRSALEMVFNGEIQDALTQLALMRLALEPKLLTHP